MEEKVKVQNEEMPKKMSYEQLENIAHQLSEQSRQLYTKLQEANMVNVFKRLDYLFKVVEHSSVFNRRFVGKCINEIEELMTIPESDENPETKTEE